MAKTAVYKFYTQRQPFGLIFGFVPNLPGCRFKGRQLDAVLEYAKSSIETHLKAFKQAGKRIPPNPLVGLQVWDIVVTLPEVDHRSVKPQAIYKLCTQIRWNGRASAFVPNLPSCQFEDQDINQVLKIAKQRIESHLNAIAEIGKPLPANPLIGIHEWDIIVDRPMSKSSRPLGRKSK